MNLFIEKIKKAYHDLDCLAVCDNWYEEQFIKGAKKHALCALSAFIVDRLWKRDVPIEVCFPYIRHYVFQFFKNDWWTRGFIYGFDNHPAMPDQMEHKAFRVGYKLGRQAHQEIKPALTEHFKPKF